MDVPLFMAKPTSAADSAGASLVPSPVMAMTSCRACGGCDGDDDGAGVQRDLGRSLSESASLPLVAAGESEELPAGASTTQALR